MYAIFLFMLSMILKFSAFSDWLRLYKYAGFDAFFLVVRRFLDVSVPSGRTG